MHDPQKVSKKKEALPTETRAATPESTTRPGFSYAAAIRSNAEVRRRTYGNYIITKFEEMKEVFMD